MDGPDVDWGEWLRRWDAQQQLHIPHREDRFAAITDAVAAAVAPEPRLLDLGCGPGSLSARVVARLPGARVVAIDSDPVLLTIGRGALGATSIRFVDADLRADWLELLPDPGPFDAAVSTTALHWLTLPQLARFYQQLAGIVREGGLFLDGDRLDFGPEQAAIAGVAAAVRREREQAPAAGSAEDWETWWAAAAAEPALAELMAERRRRGVEHPHGNEAHTYGFHHAALLAAGFREAGTIWQRLNDRVLIAVR